MAAAFSSGSSYHRTLSPTRLRSFHRALFGAASVQPTPSCESLAKTAGQSVTKVAWRYVGQPGYIYIRTKDATGQSWSYDGMRWNQVSPGNLSVFTTQTLTGLLVLPNQSVSQLLVDIPPSAQTIWMAYATIDKPDRLRGRSRLCSLKKRG